MLKLYDLTIEYKHEPLGLDEVQPRFGWKLESDSQNTLQTAYRLQLSCGGETVCVQKGESYFLPAGSGAYRIEGPCETLVTNV